MDLTRLGPPDPGPTTRPPLALWDRTKFLLLFGGVWALLVWNFYLENQILGVTVGDAVAEVRDSGRIWLMLFAVELARQSHFLASEQWAGWHHLWSERIFGGLNRRVGRLDDWNRYRLNRVAKVLLLLVVATFVASELTDTPFSRAFFELPATAWALLPMALQILFAMVFLVIQFVALFWFLSRGGVETYMPQDIKTRFSDVWGQDPVLDRVKENLVYLDEPEKIEEKGGYVPGGILLWGPPGTGKTLMAEAVAGETGKPFVFVEPGAFNNMFMGVGILKVKALFRKLRKLALRYGGVIVFFDEADALGSRGSVGGQPGPAGGTAAVWAERPSCHGLAYVSAPTLGLLQRDALPGEPPAPRRFFVGGAGGGGMGTLQSLLTELSGLKKPRGFFNRVVRRTLGMRPKPPPKYRILVMMATNMPSALDEALLRPGRVDRIYRVGYPSKEGRIRTYQGYLSKVAHELTPEQVDRLATITPYATGASIKDLVNEALIQAIRDDREVIRWTDVIRARLLKSLGPPQDVEYIERERHAIAIHEACHAVAQYHLQKHMGIDVATIEMGQTYLGMVKPIPLEEQFTSWRSEYETEIMVFLASLAGERMFFDDDNSSGVRGDLEAATTIAMHMEGFWGMGRTIGSHAAVKTSGNAYPVVDGTSRNVLETRLGAEVEERLQVLHDRVRELLVRERVTVLAVAHALETHKTITGEDVEAIVQGTEGPLVDGRLYHQPDFLDQAEEYHRYAVVAHKGKAGVDMALPGLVLALGPAGGNGHLDDERHAPAPGNGTRARGSARRRRRPAGDDPAAGEAIARE
ncbi:MAG TPA: AAA family ATPase [Acidimicrobiales bacterium]|nr:AAA family ATPase [Acidimicrobiales bacterium]